MCCTLAGAAMDTWIQEKIRAASLRRVIVWGMSVALWVLLAAGNARYIHNFVSGPFALGAAELDSIVDITTAPRYFARVSGSKVLDTGIGDYTGQYYALLVGDKYLIVEAKSPIPNVVEGELASWPGDLAGVLSSKEMGDLRHHLYPFYIGQESFRESGYFVILVLVVYGFFFARYAIPPWRHFREPSAHPLQARLGSWGDAVGVPLDIEREFRDPQFKSWTGWRAGNRYLIQSNVFRFDVHRLQDLLHAYKKVTQHRYHYIIPMGKTYEAILYWEEGQAVISGRL